MEAKAAAAIMIDIVAAATLRFHSLRMRPFCVYDKTNVFEKEFFLKHTFERDIIRVEKSTKKDCRFEKRRKRRRSWFVYTRLGPSAILVSH